MGHNCKAACLTAACHHPVWLQHHDPALMLGLGDAVEHLVEVASTQTYAASPAESESGNKEKEKRELHLCASKVTTSAHSATDHYERKMQFCDFLRRPDCGLWESAPFVAESD